MSVSRKGKKVKKKGKIARVGQFATAKKVNKKVKKSKKKGSKKKQKAVKKKRLSVDTKPRIRRPKGPPLTSEQRSLAAKKGWETRRAKAKQVEEIKARAVSGSTEDWVKYFALPHVRDQVDDDLLNKMPGIFLPGFVETIESQMVGQLAAARQMGNFDDTAKRLSRTYNWPIREVYTLWAYGVVEYPTLGG